MGVLFRATSPSFSHQDSQAKPKKRSTKKAKKSVGKKKASFKRGCKAKKGKKAAKLGGKKGLSSAAASTRAPSTPDLEIRDEAPAVADHHSSDNEQEREAQEAEAMDGEAADDGQPSLKGFSLAGFPAAAMPDWSKTNNGAFSYTVTVQGPNGQSGTIDVLLKKSAYFVKKAAAGGKRATCSFRRFGGPAGAWEEAVRQGGFVV